MPADVALRYVRSWLARPNVWIPAPGAAHADIYERLLTAQAHAHLATDAHLAALAFEHGLEVISRDRDFARWADLGLRSRDPLAA